MHLKLSFKENEEPFCWRVDWSVADPRDPLPNHNELIEFLPLQEPFAAKQTLCFEEKLIEGISVIQIDSNGTANPILGPTLRNFTLDNIRFAGRTLFWPWHQLQWLPEFGFKFFQLY